MLSHRTAFHSGTSNSNQSRQSDHHCSSEKDGGEHEEPYGKHIHNAPQSIIFGIWNSYHLYILALLNATTECGVRVIYSSGRGR